MIGGSTIARRYARAVFALGEETSDAQTMLDELNDLLESATVMPELGKVVHGLRWHERFSEDPGNRWLREQLREVVKSREPTEV